MESLIAIFDILRVTLLTLLNIVTHPKKHAARSWSTEFTFRLTKRLVKESVGQPMDWLRKRQSMLKLVTPELFKVTQERNYIEGTPCLIIEPKDCTAAPLTVIYLHGGGYCVGSTGAYASTMSKIAVKCRARVIGVDYRLCPEYPLPTAQEDCVRVVEKIISENDQSKTTNKLILMGDSAGGALCLETLNALNNAGLHKQIDACVLISPWLEPIDSSVLELSHECSDILDKPVTEYWRDTFYLSPNQEVFVSLGQMDLEVLPKLYLQAAGAEVFIKQVDQFVERLHAAKHDVQYDVFEGQFHVFQTLAPLVREADGALEKIAEFVRDV